MLVPLPHKNDTSHQMRPLRARSQVIKSMRLLKKTAHASAHNCRYQWMWVDTGYLLLRPQRPPRSLTIAHCVHYLPFLVCADFESYKPFCPPAAMLDYWLTGLVALGVGLAAAGYYRIYLHPLAKFPGPKLATLSHWYEAYYDVLKKGQYIFEIERMHQKYGKQNISLLPCWKGLLPSVDMAPSVVENPRIHNPCKPRCFCPIRLSPPVIGHAPLTLFPSCRTDCTNWT